MKKYRPDDLWEFPVGARCVNVVSANGRLRHIPYGKRTDHLYCVCAFVVRRDHRNNALKFLERGILGGAQTRRDATLLADSIGTRCDYAFDGRLVRNMTRAAEQALEKL